MSNHLNTFYRDIEKAIVVGRTIPTVSSSQGAYLTIAEKKKLNFCSNNYLGFAQDKRIRHAAIRAIKRYGVGPGAVRVITGTNILHVKLEEKLATFKKAEAAIVFQGGYVANLAAIQTFLGKEDIVVSDELNHASIIDAIRLAQIKNKFVYKHCDMVDLERVLKEIATLRKTPKNNGQLPLVLIVTDGVFSMDGDCAPLPQIVKLAKRYQALTMVDDAHGEGVLGDHGRGIVDHFDLHGQIDIDVGTLSKAFGVMGGFITGRKVLIDYLRQKARQFLFSTGITIPDAAALIAAVDILEKSDSRVKTLWKNANYLKKRFTELGFDIGNSETPITPVMLGDEELAGTFSQKLLENGVFATRIVFPMVLRGKARIRVMPSAVHTKKDLDFGAKVFHRVGKQLGVVV